MTISAAMQNAERKIMQIMDNETGEIILHGKERLAGSIVVEVLIAFFQDEEVRNRILDNEIKNEWKDAIEDAMICWEMLPGEKESPKEALNRLIAFEQSVALDPLVSDDAQKLIRKARAEAFKEAAAVARSGYHGDIPSHTEAELAEEIAQRIEACIVNKDNNK